jgi:hypothetical protein
MGQPCGFQVSPAPAGAPEGPPEPGAAAQLAAAGGPGKDQTATPFGILASLAAA